VRGQYGGHAEEQTMTANEMPRDMQQGTKAPIHAKIAHQLQKKLRRKL